MVRPPLLARPVTECRQQFPCTKVEAAKFTRALALTLSPIPARSSQRGSRVRPDSLYASCCRCSRQDLLRFSDACTTTLSARADGRRTKGAKRALRGFDRDGNADQDEVSLARRGGWGLQSEMPAALWKQLTPHNHRVLAQMRMRWSLRLFTWWRATLSTMPWPPAAASFR